MRVRTCALAVLVGVASAVAPSTASAQQWWQLCTGGGAQSCTAVHVATTALGPTSTQFAVRAQNLQRLGGGFTGPSVLEKIFLHFDNALPSAEGLTEQPTPGPGVSSYEGTNNLAGATPGPWTSISDMFTIALLADNPALGYFTDVRGCSGPSPLEDPGFVTCGARGQRWVEFVFSVDATLTDANLQSVGFGTSYGDFGLEQHVCNDAPNANTTCRVERFDPTPTTVPEPATVALLASGLAALGVVARRRRSA